MVQVNARIQRRDSSKIPGKSKNMTNRLMTNDDKITVKRRYLKPMPTEENELEKVNMRTSKYKTLKRSQMRTTCPNPTTQMLCSDVDGAIFIEKYCDDCVSKTGLIDNV
jgi:bisphosphoglycerate-dependent phosphoglycerate mutase